MNVLDRYVVIGHPVAHSKSPQIHTAFAEQTRQNLTYERLQAPLDGFVPTVRAFIEQGGKGMSVTVPFKLEARALADTLTERARAAGAVNALRIVDGRILGDNTDGAGLVRDIEHGAGVALRGKRVLMLGAGGAARGAILPLLQAGAASLTIANRTAAKATELAAAFAAHGTVLARDFDALDGGFDVVINATSASMDDQLPPIGPAVFVPGSLAYDMMYGSRPTVFLRFAAGHGIATRDGLGMLVEQAAEAFQWWRAVRPDTAPVYAALRAQT
ncbi:shikimate dehydrogenase [Massilia forsythiae]|uniref:Shikimate dehydrogenase (NADP(+)) n=1 Tax=Massilia forsythiae TaxID=2728020 RepID=A0A7Z2VZM4_9BURK|nr:shikimate dehydrogenase [Massilia forsythiae]QJE02054.1 shikimate dehydrogenase [Massilia forsythiae]